MEEIKGLSVTVDKNGYTEENMMFTYSEEEMEQNKINSKNAGLLDKVKYVQFSPSFKRTTGLGFLEVLLYGYIDFFSFNGENTIYLTNEQLSFIFNTSVSSTKRALKTLKNKGFIDYTTKTFSTGHGIKSVRKLKLTLRVPIEGQIEPSVEGQIEPQLRTSIKNTISNDIEDKSFKSKTYGNPGVLLLKDILIKKYPISINGIADSRALYTLIKVCGPRKGKDEWMDKDWEVNFKLFLRGYLKETNPSYVVRSVQKLKDLIKDWREMGGKLKGSVEKPRPTL